MKILRNVGLVVGVHALVFLVILAYPGCSSSKAASAAPADPAAAPAPAPAPAADAPAPVPADAAAPAVVFYSPTRPGTPAAAALETQPVSGVTPASTYTVASGDSLSVIARKNHLKTSELAAANHLKAGATLHLGQKLIIPAKAAPAEAPAAAAPATQPALKEAHELPVKAPGAGSSATTHVVRPGESLGSIARHYGVKVGDIATANNITDPAKIRPGQTITIPAGRGGAAKAAPKAAPAAAPAAEPVAPAPAAESAPAPAPAPASDIPVIKIDDAPPASKP